MRKKKILFLSPYPFDKAPSQRLKYEQYYPYFETAGYELTTSSFVSEGFWKVIYLRGHYLRKVMFTLVGYFRRVYDLFRLRQFDVIYIHLWVTPIGIPLFEWLVRLIGRKIIYDIDDLVYLNDKRKNNKIMLLIRGKTKPINLMKSADHVICCTPRLEEFVRKYNNQVTDISSTINTELYQPKKEYSLHNPIVIGWSGSHSTSRFLHLLREPLKKLSEKHDIVLKVIGDPEFQMEGVKVMAVSWNAEREVEELSEFDIGVYPLPLDEEWVHGKSGLKALQYMALGIPTVATAIGANFRIIEDGESGILVKEDKDWYDALISLVGNLELRKKVGLGGVDVVDEKYSIKVNVDSYINILDYLTRSISKTSLT